MIQFGFVFISIRIKKEIKQVLLCSSGNSVHSPVIKQNEKDYEEEQVCGCITEPLRCIAEISTML